MSTNLHVLDDLDQPTKIWFTNHIQVLRSQRKVKFFINQCAYFVNIGLSHQQENDSISTKDGKISINDNMKKILERLVELNCLRLS